MHKVIEAIYNTANDLGFSFNESDAHDVWIAVKKATKKKDRLEDWAHIYDFNRQIYNGDHNIYVSKNDVDMFTAGGRSTYEEAEADVLAWLNRVNPQKK